MFDTSSEESARSPILPPLKQKIQEHPDDIFQVIITLNENYPEGRSEAKRKLAEFLAYLTGSFRSPDADVGSESHPFAFVKLTGSEILRLIEMDDHWVWNQAEAARATQERAKQLSRRQDYRLIESISEDFAVSALLTASVRTINAHAAHRAFDATGRGVVWAVADSGIDARHEHFQTYSNLEVATPLQHCDFTLSDGIGSATALEDEFGHGTHVAGIIGGSFVSDSTENDAVVTVTERDVYGNKSESTIVLREIRGIAPECKLVSLKVLDKDGKGPASNVIRALDYVHRVNDYGANLRIHGVNLSLGYEFDALWSACGDTPICKQVDRLARSGVVIVAAAGNTGYGTVDSSLRSAGAGLVSTINDPGNARFAITVGSCHKATPHFHGVSAFSSKGPTVDGRVKPDIVAPGEGIISCLAPANECSRRYKQKSGTSMAAAHVSGAIAALMSVKPDLMRSPERVRDLFCDHATDLRRDRNYQGYGMVDLMRTLQAL